MPRKQSQHQNNEPAPPEGLGLQPTGESAQQQAAEEAARGRQSDPPPQCPYCAAKGEKVYCRANRSTPMFTYYYCPTEGCAYSEKRQRPKLGQAVLNPDEDFSARP